MTDKNNHIGSNFDDFMKENFIDISKLELIEKLCKRIIENFNFDSGENPYCAGRCITAEQVLNIINAKGEVENEITKQTNHKNSNLQAFERLV